MKKIITIALISLSLSAFTNHTFAQDNESVIRTTPKWISEQGYWVIESNLKTPKDNTIYFYDNDNNLVYKESITGMKIKINRTKTLMRLKAVLEQSVTAWNQQHQLQENKMRVAIALK